ncbi:hypothetical protein ACHAWF_010956 [Thalassiosira exigua]
MTSSKSTAGCVAAFSLLAGRAAALAPATPWVPRFRPHGRRVLRRSSVGAVSTTALAGPLNVMSMDPLVGAAGSESDAFVPDLLDPAFLELIDLVGAEGGRCVSADFLEPRGLPMAQEGEAGAPLRAPHPNPSARPQPPRPQAKAKGDDSDLDYPSVAKIIKFSLPAIGVWLCSPVLSMIDTASVGLLAGTAQQAALNPAISVTDYGALLVAFMYTATTNLVAGAAEEDSVTSGGGGPGPRTRETLVAALRLALVAGLAFGTVLCATAPALLSALVGRGADPAVLGAALRYVRIRSLGMPAAVVIGTAQSACLGMKDVRSPLYVLAAAAGINLLGDILLVGNASPWLGGAAGAAWATVLSQYTALIMFLRWLTAKNEGQDNGGPDVELLDPSDMIKSSSQNAGIGNVRVTVGNGLARGVFRKKLFSAPKPRLAAESKTDRAPARGFLSSHPASTVLNPLRLFNSMPTVRKFLPFVVPVTTTSVGRVSGYITMSHVASSALGTLDMAAHQIAVSIFCCLAPVVDALNQVAQSFVPAIFAREKGRARALAMRRTSTNFARVGASFGLTIAALVFAGVPVLGKCFTSDPEVLSRVAKAVPGIAVFLGFDGLMCIGEGTLLGQKDLGFLRNAYASFFFLVPALMLRLKRRALNGIEVGIGTMWGTFSIYEVVRTIMWLGRVVWLQRRMEREVEMAV